VLIFLLLPLGSGLRAIEHTQAIFGGFLLATLFSVLAVYPMTKYLGLAGVMGGITTVNIILVSTLWFGLRKRLQGL